MNKTQRILDSMPTNLKDMSIQDTNDLHAKLYDSILERYYKGEKLTPAEYDIISLEVEEDE